MGLECKSGQQVARGFSRISHMTGKTKAPSRRRLLVAASELFAEQGFDRTTTAAIARRAHTSQSQLLKYFKDKDGLLSAILNEGWQELNSAIRLATARISDPREQLKLIIDMLLQYLEIHRTFARVLLREGNRLPQSDDGTREFMKILDEVFEWMRLIGALSPGVSVSALRIGSVGALIAMLRARLFNEHPIPLFSETEMRKVFAHFLSSCVRPVDQTQLPSITAQQKDEEPWLNQYLELADLAFRTSSAVGQA